MNDPALEPLDWYGDIEVINGELCVYMPAGWQELRGRDIKWATQTRSGRLFWPHDPYPDEVLVEDMAWGISRECRFGNQGLFFYSVAQHSEVLSRAVPEHLQRWALVHDCTEAYMKDIPKPMKCQPGFGFYKAMEDRLMSVIAEALEMPELEIPVELKQYDSRMGIAEMIVLFPGLGEGKKRAEGTSEEDLKQAKKWTSLIEEIGLEQARLGWLSRYRELFDAAGSD